jgi:kinesin family protein 2/24
MEVPKIRVAVRKRPLTNREIRHNEEDIIECISDSTLIVREPKTKVDLTKYIECHNFPFDSVYDENYSNENIYQDAVAPLI